MKVLKRKKLSNMWSFLFVLCCVFTVESLTPVTAPVGGKVTLTCSHFLTNFNIKYFCRADCADDNILIRSNTGKRETRKGRYTLHDMGTEFTVTITDLRKSDSGTYICAVERFLKDTFSDVTLNVIEGITTTEVSAGLSSILTTFSKTTELNLKSTSITSTEQYFSSTGSIVIFITAGVLLLLLISAPLVITSIRMKKQTLEPMPVHLAFRNGDEMEYENVTPKVLPDSPTADNAKASATIEFQRPSNTEPGNMADPNRDSNYINVAPGTTDQEMDACRSSHVYQCLNIDPSQQSVYHIINRTAH
ncbi:CMRF35-like molecule 1 [Xyrauchen texanus]|uniref:CMRF35-like molecule 1 n=1 Tax=Xyrauchen texanus TaxID=154827 RepID=UPI002242C394|nr:CMRF35-like molecule 1 [Xyrauchen texanus]